MANLITALGRIFNRYLPTQTSTVVDDRIASYQLFDSYYNNNVFEKQTNGGQREFINAALGNATASRLNGLYNPVSEVVDLYGHVFAGAFGDEISIQSDNTSLLPPQRLPNQPAPPLTPLEQIWRWSVMDQQKQLLCRWAPTHGNVGLRVVADRERQRVYLKVEHPQVVRDVEMDERGNVTAIELEYDDVIGIGDAQVVRRIREYQDKEAFRTWTVQPGGILMPLDEFDNDLGVVPYVLLAHQPSGETWGYNAFYRALPLINELNAIASHIDWQIFLHVRAKLAMSGSGSAPQTFDFDDLSIVYFNSLAGGEPPTYQWLVAPLNIADAITQSERLLTAIEDKLPELKATAGKFLANQSGETVAQLRKPAEDRLSLARVNYEDALIRAQQIALSFGILYGVWDLGTGTGTREAADRAYQQGYEDHRFNTRPLLPLTDGERLDIAERKTRVGVSRRRVLQSDLGFTGDDATANETEMDAQQMSASNALFTGFDRG